jgi:hypothetical protein
MELVMKKKIGILLDEKIIRQAKRRAVEEGRPLSDVIQDALTSYLSGKVPDPKKREKAYQLFCDRPIRISQNQFRQILEEDTWNL